MFLGKPSSRYPLKFLLLLKNDLILTNETKLSQIWIFHQGHSGGGRGVHYNIPFKVYKTKKEADLSGIPQIKKLDYPVNAIGVPTTEIAQSIVDTLDKIIKNEETQSTYHLHPKIQKNI